MYYSASFFTYGKRRVIMKTVLTIAGSDSSGGAGIQADLKTFSAFGTYGMSVVTAVTAQNTMAVSRVEGISPEMVTEQLRMVFDDMPVDAVKTGMLFTADIVRAAAAFLQNRPSVPLVVDPVMVATSGSMLLTPEAVAVLKTALFPLADLVTPNLQEAEALTGLKVRTRKERETAARAIAACGCKAVLIKGGHLTDEAGDLLFRQGEFQLFSRERLDSTSTHGTGCTLASAVAAGLALGRPLAQAVADAKDYVHEAIRQGLPFGAGSGPVNHLHQRRR